MSSFAIKCEAMKISTESGICSGMANPGTTIESIGKIAKRGLIDSGMVLSVIILLATCESAYAELYKYEDEHGDIHVTTNPDSIPERYRSRITVIEDEHRGPVPPPETARDQPSGTVHNREQPRVANSPEPRVPLQHTTEQPASAPPKTDTEPQQQIITMNTDTRHNISADNDFFINLLQRMLNAKFKDVKDPSQLPALSSDTSIDCTKYKKILGEDIAKMDRLMKETDEKRAKGELGMIGKMQAAITGLTSIVNLIYDTAFTPKHCSEEYERENKEKLQAPGK